MRDQKVVLVTGPGLGIAERLRSHYAAVLWQRCKTEA